MDTQQNHPRFKKVKKPIRRPTEDVFMPEKAVVDDSFINNNEPVEKKSFEIDNYLGDTSPFNKTNNSFPQYSNNEDEEDVYEEYDDAAPQNIKDRFIVGNLYTKMALIAVAAVSLVLGIFFAKVFLTPPALVQNGLQGVIVNAEVPRGKARCGVAEKTQGCVLYIMNPQRQELSGRDFYDLAAQLSGRQRFMIETGNMRYASVKIRPGEIAQINIPPLQ